MGSWALAGDDRTVCVVAPATHGTAHETGAGVGRWPVALLGRSWFESVKGGGPGWDWSGPLSTQASCQWGIFLLPPWRGKAGMGGRRGYWAAPPPPPPPSPVKGEGAKPNPSSAFRAKMGRLNVSGKHQTPCWPGIAGRHIITTMFCCQLVYNVQGNMRPCACWCYGAYPHSECWDWRKSGSERSLELTPLGVRAVSPPLRLA